MVPGFALPSPGTAAGCLPPLQVRRGVLGSSLKNGVFLTVPENQNSANAACLTSGSRLKVAARGVLAALAEFWFSGTVRNTPFLRLEPKTPRRTCKGGKQPAAVPGKGRAKPGTKHLSQAPHQRPLPNPGGEGGRDGGRPHFPPENFTN